MSSSTAPSSYNADGRFVFRLKTPEERANKGRANWRTLVASSILNGEGHIMLLVHLVTGILAGVYGAISVLGLWPWEFAFAGQIILTAMKGAALGALVTGAALRWSPQGRTIKQRIQQNTATKTDEKVRLLAQLSFDFGLYVFIGVTFFEFFPKLDNFALPSIYLKLGRRLATKAGLERLWNAFERWGTAPAADAQLLRPTFLLKLLPPPSSA